MQLLERSSDVLVVTILGDESVECFERLGVGSFPCGPDEVVPIRLLARVVSETT